MKRKPVVCIYRSSSLKSDPASRAGDDADGDSTFNRLIASLFLITASAMTATVTAMTAMAATTTATTTETGKSAVNG